MAGRGYFQSYRPASETPTLNNFGKIQARRITRSGGLFICAGLSTVRNLVNLAEPRELLMVVAWTYAAGSASNPH